MPASAPTGRRLMRSYRRFRCRACGKQFNEGLAAIKTAPKLVRSFRLRIPVDRDH